MSLELMQVVPSGDQIDKTFTFMKISLLVQLGQKLVKNSSINLRYDKLWGTSWQSVYLVLQDG